MAIVSRSLIAGVVLVTASACTVRAYPYGPPRAVRMAQRCDPMYPCPNSYYWDEWRGVYVYYDGYRYYDALGTPDTYPLPPVGLAITFPPPSYVPPSYYRAPLGAFTPPYEYRSPPHYWHQAAVQHHGYSGVPGAPPPPNSGYAPGPHHVAPPPPPGGFGPPPPPSSGRAPPPPPSSGFAPPPPMAAPPPPASHAPPPPASHAPPPPSGAATPPPGGGAPPPPPH